MSKAAKMICPSCGVEMNRHAERLVYPTTAEETARMDTVLGGVIEEEHTCPRCGRVASRRLR